MDMTSKFSVDIPDSRQRLKEAILKIATGTKDLLFEYEYVPTFSSLMRQAIIRLFLSTTLISLAMAIPSVLAQKIQVELFTTVVGYTGLAATVLMFLAHGGIFVAGFAQYARDY